MDSIAIVLGLLVTGAVTAFVAWPWWTRRGAPESEGVSEADSGGETLAERREAILAALRDLDFDHAVGKVAEEDYQSLRQTLLAEAAEVMARLDEEQTTVEADLDARIEAEVLTIRQTMTGEDGVVALTGEDDVCPECGRATRAGDVYCAGCGARLNLACPECGRPVRPTDLFCTGCGAKSALAVS